ncbi:MAG: hypothetical protein IJ214_11025, partial [Clostridia bacterium]|nr:hypothetical protein [Clostridia bacterium]
MSQRELPGRRKPGGQPKNKFTYFPVCPAGFRCALCAQHARLCRAARKRWQASLLLFAAVAFTATNAALSGSLSGSERERPPVRIPSLPNLCFQMYCFYQVLISFDAFGGKKSCRSFCAAAAPRFFAIICF